MPLDSKAPAGAPPTTLPVRANYRPRIRGLAKRALVVLALVTLISIPSALVSPAQALVICPGCSSGGGSLTVTLAVSESTVQVGSTTTITVSASGGTAPYSYSYSDLPVGCSSSDTAKLTCTPTTVGNYAGYVFTVNVEDSKGHGGAASGILQVVWPTGTIGGWVLNQVGQPVVGAYVEVDYVTNATNAYSHTFSYCTTTSSYGSFSGPSGEYAVRAPPLETDGGWATLYMFEGGGVWYTARILVYPDSGQVNSNPEPWCVEYDGWGQSSSNDGYPWTLQNQPAWSMTDYVDYSDYNHAYVTDPTVEDVNVPVGTGYSNPGTGEATLTVGSASGTSTSTSATVTAGIQLQGASQSAGGSITSTTGSSTSQTLTLGGSCGTGACSVASYDVDEMFGGLTLYSDYTGSAPLSTQWTYVHPQSNGDPYGFVTGSAGTQTYVSRVNLFPDGITIAGCSSSDCLAQVSSQSTTQTTDSWGTSESLGLTIYGVQFQYSTSSSYTTSPSQGTFWSVTFQNPYSSSCTFDVYQDQNDLNGALVNGAIDAVAVSGPCA